MFLICSSCNTKYLVNSADLKPDGRTVRCSKCGYEWFHMIKVVKEDVLSPNILQSQLNEKNKIKIEEDTPNLPSTVVINEKTSVINTILVLLLLIIIIFVIWGIQNYEYGIMSLIKYYIQEFVFNTQLIINDLAKIIHKIIN